MEHHLRPLLVITILAVLLAGTGYMLWPQASKAPTTEQGLQQASSTAHELGPYSLRDGKVWYVNDEELVGASPATFSFVGGNFFGKDADHVFYRATQISGADTGSFTPVFDDKGNAPLYSKDSNRVYVSSPQSQITSVMQSADAATFVAFDADNPKSCGDNCSYDAEDKNHKYLQGRVVQESGSLKQLGNGFATDGNFIYATPDLTGVATKITGVDVKTFTPQCPLLISSGFGCDSTHLVSSFFALIVSGQYDLATLQSLGDDYYSDKQNIYHLYHGNFMGQVEGADHNTFVLIQNDKYIDARDKNTTYFCGRVYDPADTVRTCY